MLKIRWPLGRLIFNMGIAIPGKTVFLIEMAPKCHLNLLSQPSSTAIFQPIYYQVIMTTSCILHIPLHWHHNERNGISNRRCPDCLLNHLFRCRSKKTSMLCITGPCEGNSLATGEFSAQRASDVENVSIWWHHHENCHLNWYLQLMGNAYTYCCSLYFFSMKCIWKRGWQKLRMFCSAVNVLNLSKWVSVHHYF